GVAGLCWHWLLWILHAAPAEGDGGAAGARSLERAARGLGTAGANAIADSRLLPRRARPQRKLPPTDCRPESVSASKTLQRGVVRRNGCDAPIAKRNCFHLEGGLRSRTKFA